MFQPRLRGKSSKLQRVFSGKGSRRLCPSKYWTNLPCLRFSIIFFWGWVICFSNPTSLHWSSSWLVHCVPSYTLSSPAFKGVTRGMSLKHTSPPLCYPRDMRVRLGAYSTPIICLLKVFTAIFTTREVVSLVFVSRKEGKLPKFPISAKKNYKIYFDTLFPCKLF